MPVGVEDLDLCILLDAAGSNLPFTVRLNANGLGAIGKELCTDALEVQDNLGDILLNALHSGELMHYAVNLY